MNREMGEFGWALIHPTTALSSSLTIRSTVTGPAVLDSRAVVNEAGFRRGLLGLMSERVASGPMGFYLAARSVTSSKAAMNF